MSVWFVIVLVGLGSYLFRISMVMLIDRFQMPERLTRASGFVAPAAFAALAAGGFAAHVASLGLHQVVLAVPIAGAIAAAVVGVRLTGKSYVALLTGMPTLWLLTALVGA